MLGWAAGPARGQAPAALLGCRYRPLPPSGWPDKVPPADLIPCGGFPPYGRVVPPADFDSLRGEVGVGFCGLSWAGG